jgi:hypothetical protein
VSFHAGAERRRPAYMYRNLFLVSCLIGLTLVGTILIGCGSASKSSMGGGCTGGPYNVVGDWVITVTGAGGSASGPGVIDASGLAVFFQTTTTTPAAGDTVVLPAIAGTCSFSGNTTAYGTPASGGGSATDTVSGSVNSASAITGTISNGNTFSVAPNSPLSGAVTIPSGSMYAAVQGATTLELFQLGVSGSSSSIILNGTNNLGCNVSGTLTQAGANNVFDASLTFTGAACPATTSVSGVGFESNNDYFGLSGNPQVTGTYLYVVSSNSAFVFEIYPPPA